jgi:predicted nucleic acid-binding protein
MIVVSDTSPLNYLVLVDAIDVLPKLFGEVYAPAAVIKELRHPRTPEAVKRWVEAPPAWLRISEVNSDLPTPAGLDPGEAQAIALAIELHADAVLIDERMGRRIAKSQGLATLAP